MTADSNRKISITICLPSDARSVGFVRRLCRLALKEQGARDADIHPLEVALSELCTNIVEHSVAVHEYEVQVNVFQAACEIRVIDVHGSRFPFSELGLEAAPPDADSGRGLYLARALVDELKFAFSAGRGLAMVLVKRFGGGQATRL